MKPGDAVRVPFGTRTDFGTVAYVGPVAVHVLVDFPDCDEPVRRLYRAEEIEIMPQRIQRKRVKGWRMPENCVYVGRPTYWGNPYRVGATVGSVYETDPTLWDWGGLRDLPDEHVLTAQECVDAYEKWIHCKVGDSGYTMAYEASAWLRGHDLSCWCAAGEPCHVDPLLKAANS